MGKEDSTTPLRPSEIEPLTTRNSHRPFRIGADEAPRRRFSTVAKVLVVLAALGVVLLVAQVVPYTPLNPVPINSLTPQPQTATVSDVWIAANYGTTTTNANGSTVPIGTTLLLGDANLNSTANASWSIPFGEALDLKGAIRTFDLYVPSLLAFASTDQPMKITVAGQTFTYTPYNVTHYPWYVGPIYIPNESQLRLLPSPYQSYLDYTYLVFPFNSSAVSTTVTVTISLPASAQIYVPVVAVVAEASLNQYVPSVAIPTGLVLVGFLAGGAAALYYVGRSLWLRGVGTLVVVGVVVRLALAPMFLHSDLVTLSRYDILVYNYHIINLQSWTYGLEWFVEALLPPSLFYAAGINPSTGAYTLLLKLPGIAFDILSFLLILRFLRTRLSEGAARLWAVWGWLFNPLVIYFSAVHGLYESTVGFFLLAAGYGAYRLYGRTTVGASSLAVLTILPPVLAMPVVLARRGLRWTYRGLLVGLPIAAYLLVFLAVYGSLESLPNYFTTVVLMTSNAAQPYLGSAVFSPMTPIPWLYDIFGLFVSPVFAIVVMAAFLIDLIVFRRPLGPRAVLVGIYAAMVLFFFTYSDFYVQLFVWILPLFVVLIALAGVEKRRGLGFVLGISLLALGINFLADYYSALAYDPYLASAFFAMLLTPILLFVDVGPRLRAALATFLRCGRLAALVAVIAVLTLAGVSHQLSAGPATVVGVVVATLAFTVALRELAAHGRSFALAARGAEYAFIALSWLPFYYSLATPHALATVLAGFVFVIGLAVFSARVYEPLRASRSLPQDPRYARVRAGSWIGGRGP